MRRLLFVIFGAAAAIGCDCGGRVMTVQPKVTVAPRTLDFGVVSPGDRVQRAVTITVEGAPVPVRRVSLRDDVRGSFLLGATPDALALAVPVEVQVSYAPSAEGADAASLVFAFDELPEVVVPLVGRSLRAELDAGRDAGSGFDAGMDAGALDAGLDGGDPDAGPVDAGAVDAGAFDGGAPDAGGFDGGAPDAGALDGGAPDAGALDGGATDSGMIDAGSIDAGTLFVFDGGACVGVTGIGHAFWPTFGSAHFIELHWSGADYSAFFYDAESWFGRVDAQGRELPGTLRALTTGAGLSLYARAALGVGGWGYVFTDTVATGRQVVFARATVAGTRLTGSVDVPLPGIQSDAQGAIAFNPLDSQWGVFWGASSTLWFARIDGSTGQLISSSQRVVGAPGSTRLAYARSIIWSGSRFVLTWAEGASVRLVEIDRQGNLTSSSLTTVSTAPANAVFDPAVATGPAGQYGVVWQDNRNAPGELRFARVAEGGGTIANSERVVSPADAGHSGSGDLQWDGDRWFIAFVKQPAGAAGTDQRIAISWADATSTIGPVRVLTCAPGNDFFPRVTWNGSVHAIAFTHQTPVVGEGHVLLVP